MYLVAVRLEDGAAVGSVNIRRNSFSQKIFPHTPARSSRTHAAVTPSPALGPIGNESMYSRHPFGTIGHPSVIFASTLWPYALALIVLLCVSSRLPWLPS